MDNSISQAHITYRTANERDVPDILRVIQAAFAEYNGKLDPPSSAHHKTIAIVQAELAKATAILAEVGTELVGCVFYQSKEDYVYLDRLAVLPVWRGQGIAGELIHLVEQQAIQQGKNKVQLSVRISLKAHHAYYQKKGYTFKHYGTHPGYDQPTYLVLEKLLNL